MPAYLYLLNTAAVKAYWMLSKCQLNLMHKLNKPSYYMQTNRILVLQSKLQSIYADLIKCHA